MALTPPGFVPGVYQGFWPWSNQYDETANFTIPAARTYDGAMFTNNGATGSVTFTLPPITPNQRYGFRCVVDQTLTVSSNEGSNMTVNGLTGQSSVSIAVAGYRIGRGFIIESSADGTYWNVLDTSGNPTPGTSTLSAVNGVNAATGSGNAGGSVTSTGGSGDGVGAGGAVSDVGGTGGNVTTTTAGAGGAGTQTGGAGGTATTGTGGAGGAGSVTGGAGGTATTGTGGAGGAVPILGGTGGAASGAAGTGGVGGAASLTGGTGGAATNAAATACGVGGAGSVVGGTGGASSTVAVAGGAGGAVAITGGTGGAGAAAGTGGAGSTVTITGGAGGAASGAGIGGAGGNVNLVPGTGGTSGTNGVNGEVQVNSTAGLFSVVYAQGPSTVPTTATSYTFFMADRPYRVKAVSTIASVAGGSGCTVDVFKDTGTNAPGAGTSLTGGSPMALSGSANNRVTATLTATAATLALATGDRLSTKWAGTISPLAGVVVSVLLVPI